MASLLRQGKRFYCQFVFQGKRHCFPLGQVSRSEADRKADHVDYLLMRLGQGLIELPVGMDIITFLRYDGKAPEHAPVKRTEVTLGTLRDEYLKVHSGALVHPPEASGRNSG